MTDANFEFKFESREGSTGGDHLKHDSPISVVIV